MDSRVFILHFAAPQSRTKAVKKSKLQRIAKNLPDSVSQNAEGSGLPVLRGADGAEHTYDITQLAAPLPPPKAAVSASSASRNGTVARPSGANLISVDGFYLISQLK